MGKSLFRLVWLAAAALVALPGAAAGQAPTEDSVVARFSDPSTPITNLDVLALSGPSGENPSGEFRVEHLGRPIAGTVTCLKVSGRQATLGMRLSAPVGEVAAVAGLDDAGPTFPFDDQLFFNFVPRAPGPSECPAPDDSILHFNIAFAHLFGTLPQTITVQDAQASRPTNKEQCKEGGWRDFPGFRNQGECVAFVQRGPK